LACLYAYMTHKYMNRPLMVLMEHFKRLESGDMESRITGAHRDEFGVLFARFNQMVDKLNSVILQSYRQTIYLQQAELKQLQAQINPHFLYNTYFMLHRLIRKNDPHAGEFSRMLGGYFNYIAKSQDEMPLFAEEINHARNYADIQALRFEGRVSIEFDYVLPEMKNMRVPQLILQPILENAFLHGLDNIVEDGLLKVSFLIMNGAYHIFVMNNGSNISGEALSGLESALATARDIQEQECSGLINIHRRLQLTFGGGSGLKITNKNDLFTVEMIIQKNMDVNK
ncbi:MAG: histidine kinase, partial [Oscillospiraceae bacterium]|nr:histidine kinase [Oscillospiraceae bacterium]